MADDKKEKEKEKVEETKIEEPKKEEKTKFCKHCGEKIPEDAVICTKCGRQVEKIGSDNDRQIIINNSNSNVNTNVNRVSGGGRAINKWVAFVLCLFLGCLGAHKFYEGKIGMGVIYLLTGGLCGIGWIVDCILILLKPNPYYV